jgi:hypothetical protein
VLSLRANGKVEAWGSDRYGELGGKGSKLCGTGKRESQCSNEPQPVTELPEPVTAISAGESFSLALRGGTVYAFGLNLYGRLGIGNETSEACTDLAGKAVSCSRIPRAINEEGIPWPEFATPVGGIAAGTEHSLAFLTTGSGPPPRLRLTPVKSALKIEWTSKAKESAASGEYRIRWRPFTQPPETPKAWSKPEVKLVDACSAKLPPCSYKISKYEGSNLSAIRYEVELNTVTSPASLRFVIGAPLE